MMEGTIDAHFIWGWLLPHLRLDLLFRSPLSRTQPAALNERKEKERQSTFSHTQKTPQNQAHRSFPPRLEWSITGPAHPFHTAAPYPIPPSPSYNSPLPLLSRPYRWPVSPNCIHRSTCTATSSQRTLAPSPRSNRLCAP